MKKIRLAVVGAEGRMGQRIVSLALRDPRFQLVGGVVRPESQNVGRFMNGTIPVVGNIDEILPNAEAVIDFTAPEALLKTAIVVASQRRPLVVGTTGLKDQTLKRLRDLAKRIPIVFSPNMSVGVNVLFQLVAEAAERLAPPEAYRRLTF
jgi:4-hydroxy-tetrahydrodipicolinate reductase